MENLEPVIDITPEIMDLAEEVFTRLNNASNSPDFQQLTVEQRRENRLLMIHSSLALEGNALTFPQVLDIVSGQRVEASERDILEFENAIGAYNKLFEMNPYREKDLRDGHSKIMHRLLKNAGKYVDSDASKKVEGLMRAMKTAELPRIITAIVTHYELMHYNAFGGGNGLVARMWQTLMLYKEQSQIFSWLPVEKYVLARKQEYLWALEQNDGGVFVKFILSTIREALLEIEGGNAERSGELFDNENAYVNDERNADVNRYAASSRTGAAFDHAGNRANDDVNAYVNDDVKKSVELSKLEKKILKLIKKNPEITQAEIGKKLKLHKITVYRNFKILKDLKIISHTGSDKAGQWVVAKEYRHSED